MSIVQEQILAASGGLNYDDDPRMFGPGDTDYRLNVIPSSLGDTYVLTNMKGTVQKSYTFEHSAAYDGALYSTIGACYDVKRDAVYFFIHSTKTDYSILRYNIIEDTFDKIVWENPYIGLDYENPIFDAFVLDDWLFWNPRSSSPRAINVEWAYYDYIGKGTVTAVGDLIRDDFNRVWRALSASVSYPPYSNQDDFEFVSFCYGDANKADATGAGTLKRYRRFYNRVKSILRPPTVDVETDTDFEFNFLRKNVFQFTYRFYIEGQGFSRTAPFSRAIGFFTDESYNGEFIGDITRDNKLTLTLSAESFGMVDEDLNADYLFDFCEILVRNQETDEWRSVDRLSLDQVIVNANSAGLFTYEFYNEGTYDVVDSTEVEVPFDYLPITANSQCLLDGERIAYGGVVEGRNIPKPNVSLTASTSQVKPTQVELSSGATAAQDITFTSYYSVDYQGEDQDGVPVAKYITDAFDKSTSSAGDVWTYVIDGRVYRSIVAATDLATDSAFESFIVALLNNDFEFTWSTYGTDQYRSSNAITLPSRVFLYRFDAADVEVADTVDKYLSLKSGAWHTYCIYYYDSILRRADPVVIAPVYVPSLPEIDGVSTGTGYQHKMGYTVSHQAPLWATWWRFGYAGNASISDFWQYNAKEAGVVSDSNSEYDGLSFVDISTIQGIASDTSLTFNFPKSNIEPYQYVEGDRIRFLTQKSTAIVESSLSHDDWSSVSHDYEIKAFDEETNYVYFDSSGVIGDGLSGSTDYDDATVIFEIYRKKMDKGDVIFHEVGSMNRCDEGTHDNSSGNIDAGDVFLISRTLSLEPDATWSYAGKAPIFAESYHWSDFYPSFNRGWGKAGINASIGQRDLNIIRYSNRYQKGTLASSISTYDGLDYKPVSYRYGKITAITQMGGMLKVVFENNVASINVNKTELYDVTGQSQVVKSDEILGSVNYSEDSWGCINPESILVIDRHIYFFDLRRKAYVRHSSNGSFPISDYKMAKYFIDKSDQLLEAGLSNVNVRSGWNDDQGILYVVFLDYADYTNNECVMFHEKSNRWVGFTQVGLTQDKDNEWEVVDDVSVGTSPDLSLTNTVTDVQTIVIEALGSGTISQVSPKYFTTSSYDIKKGDRVSITAYADESSNQMILDLLQMLFIFYIDGDSEQELFSPADYVGEANAFTYTFTASVNQSLDIQAFVVGVENVIAGNTATIILNIDVARAAIPVFVTTGAELIGFTDDDLNLYGRNEERCNFFGTPYDYAVRVYGVQTPNMIKRYDTIAIHSNYAWDISDIQIPASVNYPNGMQSLIPEARLEEEEGVFRSDYLCNMKSTSSTASVVDLLNGDYLRGYTIYHNLEASQTSEHVLYKVDINSTISK